MANWQLVKGKFIDVDKKKKIAPVAEAQTNKSVDPAAQRPRESIGEYNNRLDQAGAGLAKTVRAANKAYGEKRKLNPMKASDLGATKKVTPATSAPKTVVSDKDKTSYIPEKPTVTGIFTKMDEGRKNAAASKKRREEEAARRANEGK